jgi:Tfp pilus assembly protein PilN
MINLLPPEVKQDYRYARLNVSLRKWVLMFLGALIGLGIITTYGLFVLHSSAERYNRQIASYSDLFEKENFTGTQLQVQTISNDLKLVVKVLSKEILFSKLIKQIGASMPDGANLTGLQINQVQGGIDITAETTNYQTATQVQVNLADPANKIFQKADIESIKCNSTTAGYPCTVDIRALFASDNPYLFINNKGSQP